jgi:hypothetical protein
MATGMSPLNIFAISAVSSGALILLCTVIFYELMACVWLILPVLKGKRLRILLTISTIFIAHTMVVWIFGVADYLLDTKLHVGSLKGADSLTLMHYIYFSGVSYSSLGFGDIYAVGGLQLVTVAESILGLTFIGWSVAFTYFVMQEYLLHKGGDGHPLAKRL